MVTKYYLAMMNSINPKACYFIAWQLARRWGCRYIHVPDTSSVQSQIITQQLMLPMTQHPSPGPYKAIPVVEVVAR